MHILLKSKINYLLENIPEIAQEQEYFIIIKEFINSENLHNLNILRTGIVHKKGLSRLQPHSYYNETKSYDILHKLMKELYEQYSKNSAVFVFSIALLTDKLVELSPPSFNIEDLPCDKLIDYLHESKFVT